MRKSKRSQKRMNTISGLIKNQNNIVDIKEGTNELKIIVKQGVKLGEALNYLPHGIINKNVTGIGATTLELKSDRHSIIVVPTKALAYGKAKNDENYLYVGSPIEGKIGKVEPEDITAYIKRTDIKHKFVIVADSLPKLIKAFETEGIDVYNQYYIMVDEIDMFQTESTYRPSLENAIDYYSKFKKENRSMVSATVKQFSHHVIQQERMVVIDYLAKTDRYIELIHTNNVNRAAAEKISALLNKDDEKIIVAYNFITEIHKAIELTDEYHWFEENVSYGILCSESSKESAGKYYTKLIDNDKLENRVTFMTKAYFAGIDINEKCHVISVSNTDIPFTLLSVDKLTQIRGRCREGALSESFIYNVEEQDALNIKDFHSNLLGDTRKMKEFYNHINKFPDDFILNDILEITKNTIKNKWTGELFEEGDIPLTRENIDGNFVESFFNIDAITEIKHLKHNVFTSGEKVSTYLNLEGIANSYEYKEYKFTGKQIKNAKKVNEMQKDKTIIELKKHKSYVDTIGNYYIIGGMADMQLIELENIYNEHSIRMKSKTKQFYELVFLLRKYYSIKSLTKILVETIPEYGNIIGIRNIRRALVFHAMADDFSFKQMIVNSFKVGSMYNSDEIEKILTRIYKTCPNNTPIFIPKSNIIFVEHLKCFFETKRTREPSGDRKATYKIIGLNPKKLPQLMYKISLLSKRANEVIDINKLMAF